MDARPVGVFDSGVGGVSVLKELTALLPKERYLYYGDSKNAPYGTKTEDEIRALASDAAQFLLDKGVKALVIACNTATSAAAATLRARWSLPIVGMEPALKPAALKHGTGKILVMATSATLKQRKFHDLMELYGRDALIVPCPGLMEFAERGETDSSALDRYLRERLAPYAAEADAVVLGCTHYVFLRAAIARALPNVPQYDGNPGTARRLAYLLREGGLNDETGRGGVEFFTSGDEKTALPLMRRLYESAI